MPLIIFKDICHLKIRTLQRCSCCYLTSIITHWLPGKRCTIGLQWHPDFGTFFHRSTLSQNNYRDQHFLRCRELKIKRYSIFCQIIIIIIIIIIIYSMHWSFALRTPKPIRVRPKGFDQINLLSMMFSAPRMSWFHPRHLSQTRKDIYEFLLCFYNYYYYHPPFSSFCLRLHNCSNIDGRYERKEIRRFPKFNLI